MAGVQCTKSYYTSYIKFDFANGPKKTLHKSQIILWARGV